MNPFCGDDTSFTIISHADCATTEKDCRYSVTGLDENTPYALLVVAANSATDDPQCVTDITLLDSRYLVLVVGTEDAPEGKLLCAIISNIQLVWLYYVHVHILHS